MPARSLLTTDRAVTIGLEILEADGLGAVTMEAVAVRGGVTAPSLYKHFHNRQDLLRQVVHRVVADLTGRLVAVQDSGRPRQSVTTQVDELRRFATERPLAYPLVFNRLPGEPATNAELLDRCVEPLITATVALVGTDDALHAARFVTAWAHGFISMELAGAFMLGGDIDAAWAWGLRQAISSMSDPPR